MTRRALVALSLAFALLPEPARADATAAAPECEREPTALARAACSSSAALVGHADGVSVVAAAVPGDNGVQPPALFTEHLAELVATRLGHDARATKEALPLATAQQRARSAFGLVYLTVSVHRDRLEVSTDDYVRAGHFWQRVQHPGLTLRSHSLTSTPLDADLRALFPPIPLRVTRIDTAPAPDRDIVALACGDVRGDGSREIAAVGRRRISVGKVEAGRFVTRAALNWADFSGIAASPLREAVGACSVVESGRLLVGISDRADALELSSALAVTHKWHGLMPWPGGGCTRRAELGYEGQARACSGSAGTPLIDFGGTVDAFAGQPVTSQTPRHALFVARTVGSDVAHARDGEHDVTLPNAGAQLAIGDLDADGALEIVSSSATSDRRSDELTVRSWESNGTVRDRFRVPVPTGVDALAVCPSDSVHMAPIVAVSGDRIWVIQ